MSLGCSRSTELALLLRQSFESVILTSLYPGSQISLHVQILQNDGAAFAASINALTLALQNAGIAMKDMLCACTVGLGDNTPLLGTTTRMHRWQGDDRAQNAAATLYHARLGRPSLAARPHRNCR